MAQLIAKNQQSNQLPLGTVVESYLTEAQFQATNGTSWVLDDGRSIVGSALATLAGITNLADLRGMVIRGKNNGRVDGNQDPGGERTIGNFQNHAFNSHNHGGATGSHDHGGTAGSGDLPHTHPSNGQFTGVAAGGGSALGFPGLFNTPTNPNTQSLNHSHSVPSVTASIASDGSNETRMRNVALNRFIKINY